MSIKWTGSKNWVLPYIKPMDECYEPFAGSGIVSYAKAERCWLNDTCSFLIETHLALRDDKVRTLNDAYALFTAIHRAPDPKQEFYRLRTAFNSGVQIGPSVFLAILYAGFNGLWREGKRGCTVPFGGKRNFPRAHLQAIPSHKLVDASSLSWEHTSPPNADCVIFADPPYDDTFVGYSKKGWSVADTERLFEALAAVPNPVILTCSAGQRNQDKLVQLGFSYFEVSRTYTNGARGKVDAAELLAYNTAGLNYVNVPQSEVASGVHAGEGSETNPEELVLSGQGSGGELQDLDILLGQDP